MSASTIIAVLGAESTGKSTLAAALGDALARAGVDAVVVPEYLRVFCAAHGRTPRACEQQTIAREQSCRIRLASERHAVVIADTTALLTAAYSELLFDDLSLLDEAVQQHRSYALTLLAGLDLPWVPDGLQRDGPQAREPVDACVRARLQQAELPFSVIYGAGSQRVQAALVAVWRCLRPTPVPAAGPRWRWACRHCDDDARCEAAFRQRAR